MREEAGKEDDNRYLRITAAMQLANVGAHTCGFIPSTLSHPAVDPNAR